MAADWENETGLSEDEAYYLDNIHQSFDYDADGNELQSDFILPFAKTEPLPPAKPITSAAQRRLRVSEAVRREALRRLELSARTVEDFQNIVKWYDKEEQSRMRKERRYESLRGDIPLEYGMCPGGAVIPGGSSCPTLGQLGRGEFDDLLLNCYFTVQDLTDREHICDIVKNLKPEHREILYFLGIRYYSTFLLAELRGQSERNIRKVRGTVQRKIHKKLFAALLDLQKSGAELTHRELEFMKSYSEKQGGEACEAQSV